MTVTLRVMSAGDGYRYLLKSVVVSDGSRDFTEPLVRYYTEKGTPPGRWLGSGLSGLSGGVAAGDEVTEQQLRRLLGQGLDPTTGEPLGRRYRTYKSREGRISSRLGGLPMTLSDEDRQAREALIREEEGRRPRVNPVAGFDLTMSVPKSVSALWAVADAGTQALIVQAHHAAVNDVLGLLEREVAMTRIGVNGVAQVEIRGVVATGYDHYDSRASDPHLHTHVVVANRVQGLHDGKWRTLDSRALHGAVVGLSETYHAVLSDRLARVLGLGWESRERGRDRNPAWEAVGVPEALVQSFSSRARSIDAEVQRLIDAWTAEHGRAPSRVQVIRLRQQATLSTRPEKTVHSMAELTERWRSQAARVLGRDAPAWAAEVVASGEREPLLRADDLTTEQVDELAVRVLVGVEERRSTWRRWNLHAEAARQSMHLRFASTEDREAVLGLMVDATEALSTQLTPPEMAATPAAFRRTDSTSAFRPRASTLYSSTELLAAEDRLHGLADTLTAPVLDPGFVTRAAHRPPRGSVALAPDQEQALLAVGISGRVVDVLVGPAGTGKTTTLGALRRAWEARYGKGSVVGLAPSAAAADVLAGDLRIPTENTAKWLHEHARGAWQLHPHQLLIVDEASLAGTLALDRLATHAAEVGAKLLLVGDWGQLTAVEAGGAFGMLVHARGVVPELFDVRRFHAPWEREASLRLRVGDEDVVDDYAFHGRVHDGDHDTALDLAYRAWRDDRAGGRASILIAPTVDTVQTLNDRARTDLILEGRVSVDGVRLHDGTLAGIGDAIIARLNDRRLRLGRGWVKNGDRFQVTAHHDDGSLTVRRADTRARGRLILPAAYVAANVELGYAVTAHRAQGSTFDTAHAIITPEGMTREVLYVSLTRGRAANHAYIITDQPHLEEHQYPAIAPDAAAILRGILGRVGAELSATETIRAEQDRVSSIAQLAAEYETIAQSAQHERWASLIENTGLPADLAPRVLDSDAFGVLVAALRRAEANGHDPDTLLPRVVAARGFDDADDPAAILHHRVTAATIKPGPNRRHGPRLIVGLIPEAAGLMPADMADALTEHKNLMRQRARALTEAALAERPRWIGQMGSPPAGPGPRRTWVLAADTVSAYRDRYRITTLETPLGRAPANAQDWTELLDRHRATAAIERARHLADVERTDHIPGTDLSRPSPTPAL